MGADTQLIAAQPGEIVMSKSAVNYWGAGNLLAMNKEGGGTNKPKMGKVAGFRGGGSVGGEYKSNVKGSGGGVGNKHPLLEKLDDNNTLEWTTRVLCHWIS